MFYLNLAGLLIAASATFCMPRCGILVNGEDLGPHQPLAAARDLRQCAYEIRGIEKLPAGGCLVAAKHQSTWDTFALLPLFGDFTFIIKRELMWIPFFGWFTIKGRQVPIDRGAGAQATRR